MITVDEIEALVLGLQWVKANGDPVLARSALDVSDKITSTVPEELRGAIHDPAVGTPPVRGGYRDSAIDVALLRAWSRQERKIAICYVDDAGRPSERTVWPFLVGCGATSRMLTAWCEPRQDFQMFRTDRFTAVEFLDQRYPEHRATLRRRWLILMEDRHEESDPARSNVDPI